MDFVDISGEVVLFSPPSRPSRKKCCSAPKASCSPSRRWEAGCRLCQQSCQLQPKESSSPPQWAKLINGCDCQFPSEEPLEHVPGFSLQQRPRMSEWECAAISGSQGSAHPCEPAQRGPPALFAKGALYHFSFATCLQFVTICLP